MRIAYVRVSTIEQNDARQVEALKKYDIEKWFDEKISGKNALRPQLRLMLDFCREGDVIYVHDLSRLARNTRDLLEIVDKLEKKIRKIGQFKGKHRHADAHRAADANHDCSHRRV